MRQLNARSWPIFHMRALVVSFASYHLWLDWKRTAHFLARRLGLRTDPVIFFWAGSSSSA